MTDTFDIVGDIHGEAAQLEALLLKMGYRETAGTYGHPEGRKLIFVGDLIDRGPNIPHCVEIAMRMHKAGTAYVILGNHECNALGFYTLDIEGNRLRRYDQRRIAQHRETVEQFSSCPAAWLNAIDWFRTLPLYLDWPHFRVVHAAWLRDAPNLTNGGRLTTAGLADANHGGNTPEGAMVKALTCGLEIDLPKGVQYFDAKGHGHDNIRIAWWKDLAAATYVEAVFPVVGKAPNIDIPTELIPPILPYPQEDKPVFFGHYWLPREAPREPIAPNIACLDYSVAHGGALTAYRWNGEPTLRPENFMTT